MKMIRLRTDQNNNTPDWSEPVRTQTGSEGLRAPTYLRTGDPNQMVSDIQAIVDNLIGQRSVDMMYDLEGSNCDPHAPSITPEELHFPTVSLRSDSYDYDKDERTALQHPQPKVSGADDVVRARPALKMSSGVSILLAGITGKVKKLASSTLERFKGFSGWYGM